MRRARAIAGLLLALLAAGCSPPPGLHEERILVFGTWVDLALWGVDEATAARAGRVIQGDLGDLHTRWHAWEPGEITRINALVAGGDGAPIEVDPGVAPVLARARELSIRSGHLFNPAIGRLIGLWGFHRPPAERAPPPAQALAALVAAAPTMADLELDGTRLVVRNPLVQLDFGAFAKGYGVDIAIGRLRELGIRTALVNAGGDLRAIGQRGDRPWRIGIRAPSGDGLLAAISVSGDESLFTSGTYERRFEFQGLHYHHIIDPRTGYPARGVTSVSVLGRDGAEADAAATALLVAGPAGWPAVARALGIEHVLLVDEQGTVQMTPAMAARAEFLADPPPPQRIVTLPAASL
ncbi:MAG TPA: FAD:protein FMN transferase [Gammaproteobacteria bacterium]